MSEDVIWIVTSKTPAPVTRDGARSGQDKGNPFDEDEPVDDWDEWGKQRVPVKAEKLQAEMASFLLVIGQVFNHAEQQAMQSADGSSKMQLDEIELSVEVNGEGQVSLLGTGGKVGGKGAITLRFKRSELQQ